MAQNEANADKGVANHDQKKDAQEIKEPAYTQEKAQETEEPGSKSEHPWEADLKTYPLRPPEEDPGWAVKVVKIWFGIAIASGLFILTLLVLGFFYD